MKCSKCNSEIKEGEEFCAKCGERLQKVKSQNNINYVFKPSLFTACLKVALYILAIAVVMMSFEGADYIEEAGRDMRVLRSVGGESVAEAYYQYYGKFLEGVANIAKVLGLTCGVVIAYVSKKLNVYERFKEYKEYKELREAINNRDEDLEKIQELKK